MKGEEETPAGNHKRPDATTPTHRRFGLFLSLSLASRVRNHRESFSSASVIYCSLRRLTCLIRYNVPANPTDGRTALFFSFSFFYIPNWQPMETFRLPFLHKPIEPGRRSKEGYIVGRWCARLESSQPAVSLFFLYHTSSSISSLQESQWTSLLLYESPLIFFPIFLFDFYSFSIPTKVTTADDGGKEYIQKKKWGKGRNITHLLDYQSLLKHKYYTPIALDVRDMFSKVVPYYLPRIIRKILE